MDSHGIDEPFRFSADVSSGTQPPAQPPDDSLLRQTRHEIRRIVQEISTLCRSGASQRKFWPKFLNLLGSAMASDGLIVWRRNTPTWKPEHHCGQIEPKLLDANPTDGADGREINTHLRMVAEVGDSGGPVMVPPGSPWDSEEPGNPTDSLAAVVPIPVDPDAQVTLLIEMFLPAGSPPSTQRGYLRFIAQMADLAADYLRDQRLRSATQLADLAVRAESLVLKLTQELDSQDLPVAIVEGIRDWIGAERVSLVAAAPHAGKVIAVTGADKIDHRSEVVCAIRDLACRVDGESRFVSAEELDRQVDSSDADELSDDHAPIDSSDEIIQSGSLVLQGIAVIAPANAPSSQASSWRLVVESPQPREWDSYEIEYWSLLCNQLHALLLQWERTHSRASWLHRSGASPRHRPVLLRKALTVLCAGAVLAIGALIPYPLTVTAVGQLQPRDLQIVYAPINGTIVELLVEHGTSVQAGQPLIQMENQELERQYGLLVSQIGSLEVEIEALQGRQNSLPGFRIDEVIELQTQIAQSETKLQGLKQEESLLQLQLDQLTIKSDRDGIVDAWQLESQLKLRPVQRGQALLRVLDEDGRWEVHAQIPQNRLDHVALQREMQPVEAQCVLSSFPSQSMVASLRELGPVMAPNAQAGDLVEAEPAGSAIFDIQREDIPLLQPGAPIEMAIACGHRPLGYVVCQDLIRMIDSTIRLYW